MAPDDVPFQRWLGRYELPDESFFAVPVSGPIMHCLASCIYSPPPQPTRISEKGFTPHKTMEAR